MLKTIREQNFKGQRVLLRLDLNAPLNNGIVQEDTRLRAALPTLEHLLNQGAKVIILTHLGRPKGDGDEALRVDPLAKRLSELMDRPVPKLDDCIGPDVEAFVSQMQNGDLVLLENTRFHAGEKKNDPEFTAALARLGDVFVSDGFGVVHRAHASTYGLAEYLPAYAGFLIEKEVAILGGVLENPQHPVALLMGGAKIDTKIGILTNFTEKADLFLIGGALANTFLFAEGKNIGASLCEKDQKEVADAFLKAVPKERVVLPVDAAVAIEINPSVARHEVSVEVVGDQDKILDLGEKSIELFIEKLKTAKTILWNGPMGLYEIPAFAEATKRIVAALAQSEATTIVGGGDSIDAIKAFGYKEEDFTHVSTGGGAMLEFLEGKVLPGIQVLCM